MTDVGEQASTCGGLPLKTGFSFWVAMPTWWSQRHAENLLIYRNRLRTDRYACVCACVCVSYLQSGKDWAGHRSLWTADECVVSAHPSGMDPFASQGLGLGMTWSDVGVRHWGQTHDGYKNSCQRKGGRKKF